MRVTRADGQRQLVGYDVKAVASTLKTFFAKLPDSLLSSSKIVVVVFESLVCAR